MAFPEPRGLHADGWTSHAGGESLVSYKEGWNSSYFLGSKAATAAALALRSEVVSATLSSTQLDLVISKSQQSTFTVSLVKLRVGFKG